MIRVVQGLIFSVISLVIIHFKNSKSSNENNSSSSKSKSLTHWKQLNQRNEKIISQVRVKWSWVRSWLITTF